MRSDFLASVALIEEGDPALALALVEEIAAAMERRFRYYELIWVVSERWRASIEGMGDALVRLSNLRIILCGDGTSFHRCRVLAASEAIGEVVALYDPRDLPMDALLDQVCAAHDRNTILIGWHGARRLRGLSHRLLTLLARHHVSAQTSQTIVLPRGKLNLLMGRPSLLLDLRYEPRLPLQRYGRIPLAVRRARRTSLVERWELLIEILMIGAPRYLKLYACFCFFVATMAVLFAAYAVAVYLLVEQVTPGWFSTSMVLSGLVFFLSTGMTMIVLALAAALERSSGYRDTAIVDEIVNSDLFGHTGDRNVEIGGDPHAPPRGTITDAA